MTFKEFYFNVFLPQTIIAEDYTSSVNQITKIVNNNGLPPEDVDKILDIYNNVRVDEGREKAKKDSDLVALTYVYMVGENIGLSIENIKREYSAYLNSETSVGKKLLSDYVINLQNEIKSKGLFKPDKKAEKLELIKSKKIKLIETIHRYQKKEEFSGKIMNEEEDKVYEDNSITIFKADSKQKCIYYGRNTNLCISTKSGNYYWKYRMGKMQNLGMTTYFIIPKNRKENELIVIDAMGNEEGSSNTFGYTVVEPSGKQIEDLYNISEKELENKFPMLQKPFNQNVFQFIPYGEKEKRFQSIDEGDIGFVKLSGYEDYEMYIQTDQFDSDNWNIIEKNVNDKDFEKLLLLASELQKIIPYDLTEKYFSEKQKERYFENIAKDPEYSYLYARDVLNGQNVPPIILQSIAKGPEYSYDYAVNVLEKGQNVPDIIEQGIAKDPAYSYYYAKEVLKGQNVPDIIEQSIAENIYYSYNYAKYVLKGKNVPPIILQSIATSPEYSYNYAKDVLKGQNVPDIIEQGIAENTYYSYNYAKDVLKGKNVPPIIEQSIAENTSYSYNYAKDVLKGQNVPPIILQSIAKGPEYSYLYARDVLKGQNVPPIILQSIAENPEYSYDYAKYVSLNGQVIPPIILQSIAEPPKYSNKSLTEAKQSLTEATLNSLSTDVIRSNSTNINSIEDRNFSSDYAADASSVIRDSTMSGFIGEGIFDDSNQLVGYGYGYRMDVNSEYNMLEYVDTSEITFFDDKFEQSVINNGIENICTPKNTFYVSNLVVDKPYRLHVKPLLNTLLNRISNRGYKYITFNGLSDTIRLFDSARKASRLSGNNLTKLAEIDTGESKFVLFYIK